MNALEKQMEKLAAEGRLARAEQLVQEHAEDEPSDIDRLFTLLAGQIVEEATPVSLGMLEGLTEGDADDLANRLANAGMELTLQAGRILELSKQLPSKG